MKKILSITFFLLFTTMYDCVSMQKKDILQLKDFDVEPQLSFVKNDPLKISSIELKVFEKGKSFLNRPIATVWVDSYAHKKSEHGLYFYKDIFNKNFPEPLVELLRMDVRSNYRNRGIGSQLFDVALQEVKKYHPKGTYFWLARPDKAEDKSRLYKLYEQKGAKVLKDYGDEALFFINLADVN